ncbi:MAG: NADH-quinone oxidoreductase subunit L, partial [candidate division Zixibacteria bacterium]|nr:NADH-quinone oxidoreductase subunit L [candidate division Zixibacteria bacterium]
AILAARKFYNQTPELATRLRERMTGLHTVLLNKYYVDEIYSAVVVRPLVSFSVFLWKIFDVIVIDGLINGFATLYGDVSQTLRASQTGRVRSYATIFVIGVVILTAYVLYG